MALNPNAGKPARLEDLPNIPRLMAAYYLNKPDMSKPEQRVAFGTSGHRGCSLKSAFTETHILAISQAIAEYRAKEGVTGPIFIGMDTHALSEAALATAVEVLAANGCQVRLEKDFGYTPTPSISHAILTYNEGRTTDLADGIVITPSHNPPVDGGFKYNPTNGGPADTVITKWVENRANEIICNDLKDVKRVDFNKALNMSNVEQIDMRKPYVDDLINIIDVEAIKKAGIKIGVDPLGGSGVYYWDLIAKTYGLNIEVVNYKVDPTFGFMTFMFADTLGIPEDPATGSANGCFAAYLSKHEILGSKNINVKVEQGYEINRKSILHLRTQYESKKYNIEVGRKVIKIAEGD